MKIRILSIIFVLTVFLSFTAITANAENGTCGDNLHWSLDNDGTLTITGEGEMVIPTDPGMGPIAPWHEYSKNIKKAVISQGITNIDQYAFENCPNLENVEIPNTVTDIECGAFAGCKSITEIEIPNGVVTIEEGAFLNCEALSGFNLPNSVRYLGGNAFNSTAWYNNQPNGVVYCGNFLYGYKGEMSVAQSI